MSNTRSDQYNKIQKDARKFYEVELVMLVNFILNTTDISLSKMAQAMGISRESLTNRMNRYRQEQLDQEEEEEEQDDDTTDEDNAHDDQLLSDWEEHDYHDLSGDNTSC